MCVTLLSVEVPVEVVDVPCLVALTTMTVRSSLYEHDKRAKRCASSPVVPPVAPRRRHSNVFGRKGASAEKDAMALCETRYPTL